MDDREYNWLGDIPLQWDTFLDTPPEESDPGLAKFFVIPIPYDNTASFRGGSRYGPRAIIEASRHLEDYELYLGRDVSVGGIHTTPSLLPDVSGPLAMIKNVKTAVRATVVNGKTPLLLGGEHTITIGAVQALTEIYSDLTVLYFDAHADMRNMYMGSLWGHATVGRRISEIGRLVEVGVRSISSDEKTYATENKIPIYFMNEDWQDMDALCNSVSSRLSDHVYISVDLDVFDPSVVSAVGTPEPGGVTWDQMMRLLSSAAFGRQIVGADICELSPEEGPVSSASTAARLAYLLMGHAS